VLKVELWMKIHGHGSDPVEIKHIKANVFEISKLSFHMSGPWEINITAKVDGHEEKIEYKVEVPER
jgi:hypothetical protein